MTTQIFETIGDWLLHLDSGLCGGEAVTQLEHTQTPPPLEEFIAVMHLAASAMREPA